MYGFGVRVHPGDREIIWGRGSARLAKKRDAPVRLLTVSYYIRHACSYRGSAVLALPLLLLVDHGHGGNVGRLWFSLDLWSRSVCWILRFALSPVRGARGPSGTSFGEIYLNKRDREMQRNTLINPPPPDDEPSIPPSGGDTEAYGTVSSEACVAKLTTIPLGRKCHRQ